MKRWFLLLVMIIAVSAVTAAQPVVQQVTHSQLQAVDDMGVGTYDESDKVSVTGVILNNPEFMLDPRPSSQGMGGQWQIYVQGTGDDHAGTAVWFGQNYSMVSSSDDYSTQQYLAELDRINTDPQTGYIFSAGDYVRVTGFYSFFRGKTNINESHQTDDFFNFEIELIAPAVGLPEPEVISLSEVIDDNGQFIFDSTRQAGAERYQARRVRVNNVQIEDCQNWGPGSWVSIADDTGRTLPVRLGQDVRFSRYDCPQGNVDVIGIFNQESTEFHVAVDGYHIWVTAYDGNGLVLTDRGRQRGNLPGDINNDYTVDMLDFAEMADRWLQNVPGLY